MAEFSRRLEVVFGARLGQVDKTHVESLVTNGVTEDFDLDFKSELYGNGDSAKRDLAGDVAALANTAGGVIVLGVTEDAQARASGTQPVALSDAEVRRMRLVVASNVAPVPAFDVVAVPGDIAGDGFYLLVVPPSAAAPHGVLVNDGFRYPVRNGSTIRYLAEPEVEAAYRERFLSARQRVERAEILASDARRRIAPDASWLLMTLVPERAGHMDIDQAGHVAFQQWSGRSPNLQLNDTFHRWAVGLHRYVADAGNLLVRSEWVRFEAHSDGSGVYALQATDESGSINASGDSELGDETLAAGVVVGLRLLAMHAQENAHASGPALVRADLVGAASAHVIALPIVGSGFSPRPQSVAIRDLESVTISTTIEDLTSPDRATLEAAAALLNQIAQQFGVPEVRMLRRDGVFDAMCWNRTMLEHLRPLGGRGRSGVRRIARVALHALDSVDARVASIWGPHPALQPARRSTNTRVIFFAFRCARGCAGSVAR